MPLQTITKNIGEIKSWSIKTPLTGHIFIFGRIGSGKSCTMLTIAQALYERGYKIWDVFGGKRNEGSFWCFPNDDRVLWEQMQAETYELKVPGPKQYKVNLLYPCFSKFLPKKLPFNVDEEKGINIKSKVFTIPFKELDSKHIGLVLGAIGNSFKGLWENIKRETDKNDNGDDIEYLMETKFTKFKSSSIYDLFLRPLIENHLLASENCDLNLDLSEEAKEKDVISVLCLDYVPKEFHFFIMGYFVSKQIELIFKDKIHKRNLDMFREASYFMKVVDSDKTKEETASIFRSIIVDDVARYGRSGLFLATDTQDSSECHGMIEGQDDLLVIKEMPSSTAREVTCKPLIRDRRMNPAQMRYIATMPIHQCLIVERKGNARILKRIQPPRCRYWKDSYGSFFELWRTQFDKWTETINLTAKIVDEYTVHGSENKEKLKLFKEVKKKAEEERRRPRRFDSKKESSYDNKPKEKQTFQEEIQDGTDEDGFEFTE